MPSPDEIVRRRIAVALCSVCDVASSISSFILTDPDSTIARREALAQVLERAAVHLRGAKLEPPHNTNEQFAAATIPSLDR